MTHTARTHQRTQVNTLWNAHKLNGIQGCAYVCKSSPTLTNNTHTLTQARTNNHWVLQGYFDFSPSVQMKCLSSQILYGKKNIQVIKPNPS